MAYEMLSVKLGELDKSIAGLHGSILMSQCADSNSLRQNIESLRRECSAEDRELKNKLRLSRSPFVSALNCGCEKIERLIIETKASIQAMTDSNSDADESAEAKLLMAEYALDFAIHGARRALLISLEAIDTEIKRLEEGKE